MLHSESYKRKMMAVMSLEVICLAKEEYWQRILDAGEGKHLNGVGFCCSLLGSVPFSDSPEDTFLVSPRDSAQNQITTEIPLL